MRLGGRNLPWTVAALLGLAAIGVGAVVLFVVHPDRRDKERDSRRHGIAAQDQQAVDAARQEAINLGTFKRAAFESDYARGVAGATGNLRVDLAKTERKQALLESMKTGKFDLESDVVNSAIEQAADGKWSVLIYRQDYKVPDAGQRVLVNRDRLAFTVVREGGKWLVSDFVAVGLI